jgi:hypothetical protein
MSETTGTWSVASSPRALPSRRAARIGRGVQSGRHQPQPGRRGAGMVLEGTRITRHRWDGAAETDGPWEVAATARLAAPIEELAAIDVDVASDDELRELLRGLKAPLDRLTALRARWAGELEHRAVLAAPPGKQQRAVQDARRSLQSDLKLTPSEAKQTSEVGRRLRDAPQARRAFESGALTQGQAAVITDTLRHIPGDRKRAVEEELTAAAAELDATALRRQATRILAREDLEAAELREQRQLARRSCRLVDREDGGLGVTSNHFGVGAELVRTAIDAYTTHDGSEERRSPEMRAADALEQICAVALRAGEAPTKHGVRPHVLVIVPLTELAGLAGLAELGFTGPITMSQISPLLQDASVTYIAVDEVGAPQALSDARPAVSTAQWRALLARDRGCTWKGCRAPASWCQVAHGNIPFRLGGRLDLNNAALLCLRHHARFDAGGWRMIVTGGTVTYQRDPTMPGVRERTLADINAPP